MPRSVSQTVDLAPDVSPHVSNSRPTRMRVKGYKRDCTFVYYVMQYLQGDFYLLNCRIDLNFVCVCGMLMSMHARTWTMELFNEYLGSF